MKQGFVLLEVLIAAFIASIIGAALFVSFFQVQRTMQTVDALIDTHARAALVQQQMVRELNGAFVPADVGEKGPELEPIFLGSQEDELFDTLTFITSNPLQGYWSARAGKGKPRIARVVYRLEEDEESKGAEDSYVLMRQEDSNLAFDAYEAEGSKAIMAYELIDNIKSMKVTYGVEIEKKTAGQTTQKEALLRQGSEGQAGQAPSTGSGQAPSTGSGQAEKKVTEFKWFDTWDTEEVEKDQRMIPNAVMVALTIWDAQQEKEIAMTFIAPIIADVEKIEQATQTVGKTGKEKAEQEKVEQEEKAETGKQEQQKKESSAPLLAPGLAGQAQTPTTPAAPKVSLHGNSFGRISGAYASTEDIA